MSSARLALVMFALAGCNGLLGLDAAIDDADGDGIASNEDNCPFEANPMQRDSDHNGLGDVCDCQISGDDSDGDGVDDACDDCVGPGAMGIDRGGDGIDDGCEVCPAATGADVDGDGVDDACDACLSGPPHDEDSDGVADACDNCPTVANTNQAETDGDVLGDACDDQGLRPMTTTFDGFNERDIVLWPSNIPGWTWIDDGLVGSDAALRFSSIRIKGSAEIDTVTPMPTSTGLSEIAIQGTRSRTTCHLDGLRKLYLNIDGGFTLPQTDETQPLPGTGPVHMRLLSAQSRVSCAAIRADGKVIDEAVIAGGAAGGRVTVRVADGGRFEYLWVVADKEP